MGQTLTPTTPARDFINSTEAAMSKGKWSKETKVKNQAELNRLRIDNARKRDMSNDAVMGALETHGALSAAQITIKTRIARSTVQLALDRLRRDGLVRMLDEKRRVGQCSFLARVYELGVEEDRPIAHGPVEFVVHRHPMDVALFGEYRRAA